ncbi:MAG: spermidine/putrescine ABC transporter substrate-binding protein [Elusimicrobia bacterium]|nr:spermidine/putrescine ABC transporter substrate-binding protein [Elusimicrobiota bacterium]
MPKQVTRREFLRLAVAGAASPWLLACASGEKERAVNFFNWSKYIGKDTLPGFTKATGIKVNYEEFADEQEMFAKLRSGARGYDLIIGSDYMIPSLKGPNIIDPFPPGVLKNLANIDAKFLNTPYDPDNAYTVPYLWGTTGIGYNKKHMPKPPTSWWDLWDEKYSGKVSMLDNARDCVSTGLLLKGYPETATDENAFKEVRELLVKQKPLVKQYSSTQYMDSLVAGELFMAMAWSGDVLQAARENPQLDYVIPKEGSYMWVDNLCLVRGSQHREDTLRLVDYLLEGPVGAEIANTVRYATPNAEAKKSLDKSLLKDPRVFPPAEITKRLNFHSLLEPDVQQIWTDTWEDVKAAG